MLTVMERFFSVAKIARRTEIGEDNATRNVRPSLFYALTHFSVTYHTDIDSHCILDLCACVCANVRGF